MKRTLKQALRSIRKQKHISLINILGLAIGIATFVLIMIYVTYEKSYDKFFSNSDRIYRVYMEYLNGNVFEPGDAETFNLSGPGIKENFPEVEDFVTLENLNNITFVVNEQIFNVEYGHLATPSYFNVFGNEIIEGGVGNLLEEPNTIVLTETLAAKLFGTANAVGKTLEMHGAYRMTKLTVTAVMRDIPRNTHYKIDFLASYSTGISWNQSLFNPNWNTNNYHTYILLREGAKADKLREKITSWKFATNDERHNIEALTDIHLHSNKPYEVEANGSAQRVSFLIAIGLAIIIISWLNYINASITLSFEKAKEICVRKVSGARKSQLIGMYLTESFLINVFGIALALLIVFLVFPFFRNYLGEHFSFSMLTTRMYFLFAGIIITGGLVSGLYPALLLSKHQPASVLKGKAKRGAKYTDTRKILVVCQFAATILLLISTFTINKQIRHLQSQPLGMNPNQVIAIKGTVLKDRENLTQRIGTLKQELKKLPFVSEVATTGSYAGQGANSTSGFSLPNDDFDGQSILYLYDTDEDYFNVMEIEILAGRGYTASDQGKPNIILNETAAKKMGFYDCNNAINQQFELWNQKYNIIGVINDYNHFGFKSENKPFLIRYQKICRQHILVKIDKSIYASNQMNKVIDDLKASWYNTFKHSTFHYAFVDEQFGKFYEEEIKFNKAFSAFTMVAILIAAIGLIVLASFICLNRTKEIGVRRTNGARVVEILTLLNTEFIVLVFIGFIVAVPASQLLLKNWLQSFAVKTELSWWIYIVAGIISLLTAIAAVSWHSWRAATRNPVEALRYE